jgi:arylsulfatase A-like enzyme
MTSHRVEQDAAVAPQGALSAGSDPPDGREGLQARSLPELQSRQSIAALVNLTIWFGLMTGLIEGTLFLVLHRIDHAWGVWTETLWISTVFDFLLFSVLGLALIAVARVFPSLPMTLPTVFLYASLAFFDWLALTLYEHLYSVAIVLLAIGAAAMLTRWFRRHAAVSLVFCRKSLPLLAGGGVVAFIGIEGGGWLREWNALASLPPAAPGSPNVLVLVVDALRADHLSCYGYGRQTSPNIDRIAEAGVVFENAYAVAPYTLPAHASMLTGLYPNEHGVEWQTSTALRDGPYPTLGEALLARGYRTAGFSANTYWFTREQGFGRGFMHFEDFYHSTLDRALRTFYGRVFEIEVMRRLGYVDIPARKHAPDNIRSLLSWIDGDRTRPFFAFINFMDVHDPRLPPQPFRGQFANGGSPGGLLNWRVNGEDPQLTPEQVQSEIDAYDGAIAYLDDQIGHLLDELHARGLAENTLIILTSDHGDAFGEHGMFLHGHSLYQEEIRVPLIVWRPGQAPANVRVSQPSSHAAIPATVLDLISPMTPKQFPGPSLREFWETSRPRPNWLLPLSVVAKRYWVSERFPVHYGSMRSVSSRQFHYIEHDTLGERLYDLGTDPQEAHNLLGKPEGQQRDLESGPIAGIVAELKNGLRDVLSRQPPP